MLPQSHVRVFVLAGAQKWRSQKETNHFCWVRYFETKPYIDLAMGQNLGTRQIPF